MDTLQWCLQPHFCGIYPVNYVNLERLLKVDKIFEHRYQATGEMSKEVNT